MLAVALALIALAARTEAAPPLKVGPGETYATPCAAIAAASANDVIEVADGTYTDSCAIDVQGLTLRGASGAQPKIDLSGTDHPAQYKAIYVVSASDVSIENLELTGAHISADNGLNGAGIRIEAPGLTVRGCNIHDNQDGVLGGTTGTVTIERTEFSNNGLGDGCNQGGCTHNVYIADIDTLYFRYNWSHHVATDTPNKGHLLKSRAKTNYVLYNRLSGEDGFDSYEVDLPNGGLAILLGNIIEKGKSSGNGTLFAWGEEGASNPDKRAFVVNNTFVNDKGSGRFIDAAGATLVLHNNLFAGSGNVGNGATLSADNWTGADPGFLDPPHFDYHLVAGAPVLGLGVDPGMADQFSLVADHEYLHPASEASRASIHDPGAFESGSPAQMVADAGASDAGGSGGAGGATGGASGSSGITGRSGGTSGGGARAGSSTVTNGSGGSGGTGARSDAGSAGSHAGAARADAGASQPGRRSSGGCGCSVLGAQAQISAPTFAFCLALAWRLARRRSRTSARAGRSPLALAGVVALLGCSSDQRAATLAGCVFPQPASARIERGSPRSLRSHVPHGRAHGPSFERARSAELRGRNRARDPRRSPRVRGAPWHRCPP